MSEITDAVRYRFIVKVMLDQNSAEGRAVDRAAEAFDVNHDRQPQSKEEIDVIFDEAIRSTGFHENAAN